MAIKEILGKLEREDLNELARCFSESVASEAEKHSRPSLETIEHFKNIEDKFEVFIADNNKQHEEIKITLAELPKRIFDEGDKKFASKATEKIVYSMIGVITLGVLYALLSTVVNAF